MLCGFRTNDARRALMGITVIFQCGCCSYRGMVPVGGTRGSTKMSAPAYCLACEAIVRCDYSAAPLHCGVCVSYEIKHIDDSDMFVFQYGDQYPLSSWSGSALPSIRKVIRSRYIKPTLFRRIVCRLLDLLDPRFAPHDPSLEDFWDDEPERVRHRLYRGKYYCPKCKKHDVTFKDTGVRWS